MDDKYKLELEKMIYRSELQYTENEQELALLEAKPSMTEAERQRSLHLEWMIVHDDELIAKWKKTLSDAGWVPKEGIWQAVLDKQIKVIDVDLEHVAGLTKTADDTKNRDLEKAAKVREGKVIKVAMGMEYEEIPDSKNPSVKLRRYLADDEIPVKINARFQAEVAELDVGKTSSTSKKALVNGLKKGKSRWLQ